MYVIGGDQIIGALLMVLGFSVLVHVATRRAVTGRDVHREWRDGMLAQGRPVPFDRMAWDRLSKQDRELDERIATAITHTFARGGIKWWRLLSGVALIVLSVLTFVDVVRLATWLFPPGPGVP